MVAHAHDLGSIVAVAVTPLHATGPISLAPVIATVLGPALAATIIAATIITGAIITGALLA